MTQRGRSLRLAIAAVQPMARRQTLRATAMLAVLAMIMLTPTLIVASSAAPALTRSRTVKPRHEFSQPMAASAGRVSTKPMGHAKRVPGKVQTSAAVAHERAASPAHRGKLLRGSAKSVPQPVATRVTPGSHGTLRHALPRQAAAVSRREMRHGRPARHGLIETAQQQSPDPQTHPAPKAAQAGIPGAAVAGGELTMDDFLHVAGTASAGMPMLTATNTHHVPQVQRVDGFGAEGAVLSQPRQGAASSSDTLPDTALTSAAAGDPRVRALVHPSQADIAEELSAPMVLPGLYRNGRLMVPAPMKGSRDILVHQNTMADDEGLERVRDEDELQRLRATRQLVDFPESASLHVNPELGANRRCARVWTVKFAEDTARAFYARFHEPLQVNSAVRTVAYQLRLQRVNGNAAGIRGETSSPHLTGQAIDFGKRGMSVEQIAWMRAYLGPMMAAGKVDVEEEFQQACFHISVYRSYLPQLPATRRMQVAAVTHPAEDNQ